MHLFPAEAITRIRRRRGQYIQKDKARKMVNHLYEWDEAEGNWYLIMGGSMGFGNITGLIRELDARTDSRDRIVCICGRKVSLLMDASDVLMTKPGGITSTEAIIKNIPLVHIDPIKGLEEDNAAFFHKSGMAFWD